MLSKEQNIAVQPKIALDDLLTRCTDYDNMSLSMDAGELKALKQHISLLESSASTELLSLREQLAEKEERLCRLRTSLEIEMKGHEAAERQLAELKALPPVGYVGNSDLYALSTGDLGCIAPYNAFEGIPLFTAAKPAED